jgi:hypothetical protein
MAWHIRLVEDVLALLRGAARLDILDDRPAGEGVRQGMCEAEQCRVAEYFDPGTADTVGELTGGLTGGGRRIFAADGG